MPRYQAPGGYQADPGSGLYYKETRVTAPDGRPVRHIYWFDAETGEYTQANYPLEEQGAPKKGAPPRKRRGLRRLAIAAAILLVFVTAVVTVRFINAPDTYEPTPEELTEIAGIAEPDWDTEPVFETYAGGLHLVEDGEAEE